MVSVLKTDVGDEFYMALELFSNGPLEGGTPSPFTCSSCGRVAVWKQIEGEANLWWLEVPCVKCGSSSFRVPAPDMTQWVFSEGTND